MSNTEIITPQKATEYLNTNTRNRAITRSRVEKYKKCMAQGRWVLNGQTIVFDEHGNLIDGQHRLIACAESGHPFITAVFRGVTDPRAFATTDTGKARNANDIASYVNEGRYTRNQLIYIIAAARVYMHWVTTSNKADFSLSGVEHAKTDEELAEFVRENPDFCAFCIDKHEKVKVLGRSSRILPTLWIIKTESRQRIMFDEFEKKLIDGLFETKECPVYLLHKFMMQGRLANSKKSERREREEVFAMIFKSWNLFSSCRKIKLLRWSPEKEPFPIPR